MFRRLSYLMVGFSKPDYLNIETLDWTKRDEIPKRPRPRRRLSKSGERERERRRKKKEQKKRIRRNGRPRTNDRQKIITHTHTQTHTHTHTHRNDTLVKADCVSDDGRNRGRAVLRVEPTPPKSSSICFAFFFVFCLFVPNAFIANESKSPIDSDGRKGRKN